MKLIELLSRTGDFAEDKDVAKKIRIIEIDPEIKQNKKIQLDFAGVTSATQSFIHALISQVIRDNGIDALDNIQFKNCNSRVKTIIEIVVEYVQDGIFTEPHDQSQVSKPEVDESSTIMKPLKKRKIAKEK